ncbi:uncharacterized protein LOC125178904 [Hyalella azteca]|uniref:Uncharacterized protein LOC125178904 n=1 Tax=Hyalella azteca TaxID=294128 RepID=A0A979FUH4_HYAAZ|nr:uncharacterized protein LOC125178904 [Hyalella azteca]
MLKWLVTRNPGTDEPGQSTDRYFVHSVSGYLDNSELPPTVNLSLDNSTAIIQQHLLPSVYYRRTQQPNDRLLNNNIAGIGDSEKPGSLRTNHLHSKNLSLPNEHRQGKHYHYAVSDILVANEAQMQAAMAAPNFLSSEVVQDKRHAGFSSSPPSTSADVPQESHVSQKLWSHPVEAQMLVGSEHFLMTALPASELHHLPASELHHLPTSELRHLTHERKVLSAAITDDPLATLSGRRHKRMHEEIYAVSRSMVITKVSQAHQCTTTPKECIHFTIGSFTTVGLAAVQSLLSK